jgi:hypothetical protein
MYCENESEMRIQAVKIQVVEHIESSSNLIEDVPQFAKLLYETVTQLWFEGLA